VGVGHYGVGTTRGTVPATLDLSKYLDRVLDQLSTNQCVGCATATSIYLRGQYLRTPVRRPSSQALYAVAQMMEGGPILDVGCRPAVLINGAMEYGVVAEDRYPIDVKTIRDEIPLDVFEAGQDALVEDWAFLRPRDISFGVRSALCSGVFPTFGMPVDDEFMTMSSSKVYGPSKPGPTLGSHMMCMVGYYPGAFVAVNSWGEGWGDSGFVHLSEDWVNTQCDDFTLIYSSPVSR